MTALIVSGRECDVEGCNHRGYLERDHLHDHAKGGPTSFANLGWLCYWHHRLKSSGWQLGPADPVTRKRTLRPPIAIAA
jgi:5-methylcytosine-specific restriction endonuclease McrA